MVTAKDLAGKAAEFRSIVDAHLPAPSPMNWIAPDHALVGTEVMWGGVWQQPDLEPQMRAIASITAQCVNGWDFGLRHQIRVGLTLGLTPQKVKAMFVELKFYAGVPASVFALLRTQEVIDEREEWQEADQPLAHGWLDDLNDKMERGREARRAIWGAEADQDLAGSIIHDLVPGSAEIVESYLFGEIWERSPLSDKERMVMLLSVLHCRQHFRQFREHVGYALGMGMSEREICEVVAQSGWYRGWPHVEDALIVANEVFKARAV